jgi:type II secretory pathway pseudopilin PulG
MRNCNRRRFSGIRHPDIRSAFDIRHSSFRASDAFTLLELLVVITIIIALAGLILGTVGYVQKKGARSRAEAEIAALSAALESYKSDNGIYWSSPATISLTATDTNLVDYWPASLELFKALAAQNADGTSIAGQKSYMTFKPSTLGRPNMALPVSGSNQVLYLRDPFGNSYGYSTSKNPDANPNASTSSGYNPTFDLWSTGGDTAGNTTQWLKNW